jgi:pimeloyl-ACP methyl ester carboxylesterase
MDLVEALVPSPEVDLILNSGHFPMFEQPEALNLRIGAFLASIE